MNKKKTLGAITVISALLGLLSGGIEVYAMYQTILHDEQAEIRVQEQHESELREKAIILGELEAENLNERIEYAQHHFNSCIFYYDDEDISDEEERIRNMLDMAKAELNINGDLEKAESHLDAVATEIITCEKMHPVETRDSDGGGLLSLFIYFPIIPLMIAGISGILWKKQGKTEN